MAAMAAMAASEIGSNRATSPKKRPSRERTPKSAKGKQADRAAKPAASAGARKRKYGAKAAEKVEKAMHELKRGELRSSSGEKVARREQAIAIGLSQARAAGAKVPRRRSGKSGRSRNASN